MWQVVVSSALVRSGVVAFGAAWHAPAWATDGGTEGSSLPAILTDGHGATRPALARYGMARRGRVCSCGAWQQLMISALSPSGLSAGFF